MNAVAGLRSTLEADRASEAAKFREHEMNRGENKSEERVYGRGTVRIPDFKTHNKQRICIAFREHGECDKISPEVLSPQIAWREGVQG